MFGKNLVIAVDAHWFFDVQIFVSNIENTQSRLFDVKLA